MNILILHGPNLNLLGQREPEVYGSSTLAQINQVIRREARKIGIGTRIYQRNGEGQLIDLLHRHRFWADGVILNPGAYTHYSYALRDAVAAVQKPTIEVHLSDIHKRESWRKISVIKPVCVAQLMGKGVQGYLEALVILRNQFKR